MTYPIHCVILSRKTLPLWTAWKQQTEIFINRGWIKHNVVSLIAFYQVQKGKMAFFF